MMTMVAQTTGHHRQSLLTSRLASQLDVYSSVSLLKIPQSSTQFPGSLVSEPGTDISTITTAVVTVPPHPVPAAVCNMMVSTVLLQQSEPVTVSRTTIWRRAKEEQAALDRGIQRHPKSHGVPTSAANAIAPWLVRNFVPYVLFIAICRTQPVQYGKILSIYQTLVRQKSSGWPE